MMVTTTENIPGRDVKEVLGVVFGSCVQTKHLGRDLRAAGRTIIGGEAKTYTELMEEAAKAGELHDNAIPRRLAAMTMQTVMFIATSSGGSAGEGARHAINGEEVWAYCSKGFAR